MKAFQNLIAPLTIGMIALASAAYLEGNWNERWRTNNSQELDNWASNLAKLPKVIGDWEGTDLPQEQDVLDAAGIVGSISRQYENKATGRVVSLFLVVGGSRKVAVHTPDKCYKAAGYRQTKDTEVYEFPNVKTPASFKTAIFNNEVDKARTFLRVFWGWNVGNGWQAPGNERWAFRGRDALYKMYLITEVPDGQAPILQNEALQFLRDAEESIASTLFPNSPQPTAAPTAKTT